MVFHIEKNQNILGTLQDIYYIGGHKWSTNYDVRKLYETEQEANANLYGFGGAVVSE